MALIKCADCSKEFSDAAAACPNCGRPNAAPAPVPKATSRTTWGCLVLIIILVIGSLVGNSTSDGTSQRAAALTSPAPYQPPALELESWTWSHEYGYATAEGRVKNISSEPLSRVEAVVSYSTKDGTFITSDDAIIEFDPILPGQTSPFKVITSYNPAMSRASVDFKKLMGGSIQWREREMRKAPPPKKTTRTRTRPDSAAAYAEKMRKMDSAIFTPIFAKP